jgi:hypothetical protein
VEEADKPAEVFKVEFFGLTTDPGTFLYEEVAAAVGVERQ